MSRAHATRGWSIAGAAAVGLGGVWGLSPLPWEDAGGTLTYAAACLSVTLAAAATLFASRQIERHLQRNRPMPHRTFSLSLAAALTLGTWSAAAWAQTHTAELRAAVVRQFGPPAVTAAEAYANAPITTDAVDHSGFHALLQKHVDAEGWVSYAGFAKDAAALDTYITLLGKTDLAAVSRDERLAALINGYNAFTLRLILDHWQGGKLKSIRDIPDGQRWDAKRWQIAGGTYSLNQIEHELIRPKFKEPRIHWAVVCAAYSCPPLRNEAYTASKLEAQLADQERIVHTGPRWARVHKGELHLTKLYEWYAGDFKAPGQPNAIAYAMNRIPALTNARKQPPVKWIAYDWALNDVKNR